MTAAAGDRRPQARARRRRRADGAHGPRRAPRPQAGAALRRPAAARRGRPRADLHADRAVRRRADRQPGLRRPAPACSTLLRTAVDEDGQTTVMVTHDARAAATADRVLFLADGRVVADLAGPTEEADPQRDEGRGPGMIRVAWKGLAARPRAHGPDHARHRDRRGVRVRGLHAHGHDVRRGGQRSRTPRTTARTPSSSRRPRSSGSQTADIRAVAPTVPADDAGARCAPRRASTLAVGDITDQAQIIGADGKPVGTGPYFGVGFDAKHAGRRAADAVPAARGRVGDRARARS